MGGILFPVYRAVNTKQSLLLSSRRARCGAAAKTRISNSRSCWKVRVFIDPQSLTPSATASLIAP